MIYNTIFSVRARKAGRTISAAKSAAARENGKLGGRPRKQQQQQQHGNSTNKTQAVPQL